jgi:predicted transcriptional regulator
MLEEILAGSKKFEFRKRVGAKEISAIFIYSTSPDMKIVAEAEVRSILIYEPRRVMGQHFRVLWHYEENSLIDILKIVI